MKTYSNECLFCVKYAKEHGIISSNFEEVARLAMDLDLDFNIVQIKKHPKAKKTKEEIRREFFEDVAANLRLLWPAGSRNGSNVSWRCDKLSLASRLMTLWRERKLSEDITKEEILKVARDYIAKFEGDMTYMKTCKYFVYKHVAEETNGRKALLTCESLLADGLEAIAETKQLENEWDSIFNEASIGEGELI